MPEPGHLFSTGPQILPLKMIAIQRLSAPAFAAAPFGWRQTRLTVNVIAPNKVWRFLRGAGPRRVMASRHLYRVLDLRRSAEIQKDSLSWKPEAPRTRHSCCERRHKTLRWIHENGLPALESRGRKPRRYVYHYDMGNLTSSVSPIKR